MRQLYNRNWTQKGIWPKVLILSFGMLLFTCNDALQEVPPSLLTSENFYLTAEDALLAVNAAYDHMGSGTSNSDFGGVYFNTYWVIQAIASDEGKASGAANPEFSLPLTNFQWNANNGYIEDVWEDCYKTINVANLAIANIPPIEMEEQLKNRFLGEARFIRGLMYFELVRMFGDLPLVTTPTGDLSVITISRSSVDEVYEVIIADLEFAKEHLPLTYTGSDLGRATTGAASGYLSKVYLTREEWQLSVDEAQEVIDGGVHQLLPDYAEIFKVANNNNPEMVFSVNFTLNNDAIWETSQFNVRTLPLELSKNSNSWELPTQYLYDAYDPIDLRRDPTVKVSWTNPANGEEVTFEPHIFKYWDEAAEPNASSSGNDFFNLRYSDILLMKAEALSQQNGGPNAEAYAAINEVRNRAGLPNLPTGQSAEQFLEAVLMERFKEFAFEGQRWFDLVRTGKLKEKVELAKPNVTVDPTTHILFPIPQREIDVNANLLPQNNGY